MSKAIEIVNFQASLLTLGFSDGAHLTFHLRRAANCKVTGLDSITLQLPKSPGVQHERSATYEFNTRQPFLVVSDGGITEELMGRYINSGLRHLDSINGNLTKNLPVAVLRTDIKRCSAQLNALKGVQVNK